MRLRWIIAILSFLPSCFVAPSFPTDGQHEAAPEWWPGFATVFGAVPCAGVPIIDGKIDGISASAGGGASRGGEWGCAASIVGRYGRIYVRFVGSELYLANDWRLRTEGPTCPQHYNAFWLYSQVGVLTVRVYGDNHMEVWKNGHPIAGGVGAAGFGPSPTMATPHAM